MSEFTLYSYWRSTTSYRIRIAMHLKGLTYTTKPVDLVKGEQSTAEYSKLNPGHGVPSLVLPDGTVLTQSMAIMHWLDRVHPDPPLTSGDPAVAARIEAAAMIIACDIHPVNNLKVVNRIKAMGHSQDEAVAWMHEWMRKGFNAFQSLIPRDGAFSFGEAPSLADICLVPQLYNAHRWNFDLADFARLTEIETRCLQLLAFDAARPENQPDAASN